MMLRVLAGVLCAALLAAVPATASAKVTEAWPANGKGKPSSPLARYLAQQVGPLTPPKRSARLTAVAAQASQGAATVPASGATDPLRLVRSFDIPVNDPSYARLLNLSFTYDSALAATAFVEAKAKAQAEQLLDQLKALQASDGSIAYAYDVFSGAKDANKRSGTIAWLAIAAATYSEEHGSSRYGAVADKALDYLLTQRDANRLVKGGPDVRWVSTQHNLLTYFALLSRLVQVSGERQTTLLTAAVELGNAIDRNLITTTDGLHFKQGLGDEVVPLDVQALGSLYLRSRQREGDARTVVNRTLQRFALTNQKIVKSSVRATFNETYASNGPFRGFRPYQEANSPSLIWMEGTLEQLIAMRCSGVDTSPYDASIRTWNAVGGTGNGPLQANKTVTDSFNEYHVWPVSATASWTLLRGGGLFSCDDDDEDDDDD